MELLLALLYPGGIGVLIVGLFCYLRSQEGKRTLKIAKTNLTPVEDIATGYKAVAASMKALRRAKQEEHQLLLRNWQNSYLELLPDTDPEKATHQARIQGVKIETAGFTLDSGGMKRNADTITAKHLAAKTLTTSYTEFALVEDGPEWVPLPYARNKINPNEELSYSQRRIQSAGAFIRSAPSTTASTYGVADGGTVLPFDGYVHGEAVAGNRVWFVYIGKDSGLPKFVHSIATTNRSISGMRYMDSLSASFEPGTGSAGIQGKYSERM